MTPTRLAFWARHSEVTARPSCSGTSATYTAHRLVSSAGPAARRMSIPWPTAGRTHIPAPRPRSAASAARGGTVTENRKPYPVRVNASEDVSVSRWLWLVKWLLLIPHFFVLFFLWVAFCVVTVIAFFAILITARYPRGLFEFNVGVLRWTWRVHYYGYWALGTDRYPPFTLADVPDYPAHLDVDYPERLSRGLVLVKWWLLAIPHYVVVSFLVGGGGGGLIGILVLVAAVVLLFRDTYPESIFDLVIGLNRWSYRVVAYAGLM